MIQSSAYFEVRRALAFALAHCRENLFCFKDVSPSTQWQDVPRQVGGRMFRQLAARYPDLIEYVDKTPHNEAIYRLIRK
jgi:hypothetical protein